VAASGDEDDFDAGGVGAAEGGEIWLGYFDSGLRRVPSISVAIRKRASGFGCRASGFGLRASGLDSRFRSPFHCYISSLRRSVAWPKPDCRSPIAEARSPFTGARARLVTDVTNSLICRDVLCGQRIVEMSGTYRDLEAWQCARALVVEIYRNTASFPPKKCLVLPASCEGRQVSVASNIAEGKGRFSDRRTEPISFRIARVSV